MFGFIWFGGIVLACLVFSITITLRYDCDNFYDATDEFLSSTGWDGQHIALSIILLAAWPISLIFFIAFIFLFAFPYKLIIFTIRSFRSKK